MVITNKNYAVSGNAALLPQRRNQEDERLKKSKEEYLKNKKKKQNKKKAKIMGSIILAFVVGVVLIYRYSKIYTLQKEFITVQKQNDNLAKQSDDLHYQLAKYNNINYIEQRASELQMVQPNKDTAVRVNLNKPKVTKTIGVDNGKKSLSIIDMIKSKFF